MPIQVNGSGTITGLLAAVSGGGANTTSAVDVTLTNPSAQMQDITMTAADKFVILPSATTLSPGANLFQIYNDNGFDFGVKDSAGNIICGVVKSNQTVSFSLLSNAAAAGVWVTNNTEAFGGLSPISASTTVIYQGSPIALISSIVPLTSTTVLILYNSDGINMNAVVATISGTTATFGTPVVVRANITFYDANFELPLIKLSSTLVVAGYILDAGGSPGAFNLNALSISGTTITVGTAVSLGNPSISFPLSPGAFNGFPLSATTGVVFFPSTTVNIRAFSVSGTTITLGTAVTNTFQAAPAGINVNNGNYLVAKVDTNKFILLGYSGISTAAQACTISGTTVTLGANTASLPTIMGSNIGSGAAFSPQIDMATFTSKNFYTTITASGTTLSLASSGSFQQMPQGYIVDKGILQTPIVSHTSVGQSVIVSNAEQSTVYYANINSFSGSSLNASGTAISTTYAGVGKVYSNGYTVSVTPLNYKRPAYGMSSMCMLDANTVVMVTPAQRANSSPFLGISIMKVK
jgi:hypothetical protein